MGMIYQYSCSSCPDILGTIYYGIGMMYPISKVDNRLFGCYDCGEVFGRNINKKFNRCPNCKKKPKELVFHEKDEFGFTERIESEINFTVKNTFCLALFPIARWWHFSDSGLFDVAEKIT